MNRRIASLLTILPLSFLTTCTTFPELNARKELVKNKNWTISQDDESVIVSFQIKNGSKEYRLPKFVYGKALEEMSELDHALASETSFLEKILKFVDGNHDGNIDYTEMTLAYTFSNDKMLKIKDKSIEEYFKLNPEITAEDVGRMRKSPYVYR